MAEVLATSGGVTPADATTRTFALPAGVTPGQLLLAAVTMDDALGTGTLTLPAGWTLLADNVGYGAFGGVIRARISVAWKIATADDVDGSLTATAANTEAIAAAIYLIANHDAATPPEISTINTFAGGAARLDPPSLTPSWGSEATLWVAVLGSDPGYEFPTAGPSGYTNFIEFHRPDNDGTVVALASNVVTAATENPGPFTVTGDNDPGTYTLAVRTGTDGPPPLAFSVRLSGGATNTDPTLSIGGVESSTSADNTLFDDVDNADRVAGLTDYRLVYLHNDDTTSGVAVAYIPQNLEAGRVLAVGAATEAAGSTVTAIANDTTAPAGVTFSSPTVVGAAVDLGTIAAGQGKGVWIRRTVTAGTATDATNPATITFDITRT